ncbi:hypothetical protein H4R20_003988 [Coemansia guatemalensis]|uniref:Integral membrane protein n=1 Tax=Coemansia guatemalensis TaxID=2761395 RepID=A0A9W8HX24_9FUNG|nr:hypothetical protein H4R20_003988 [Coemansia guatemalensis]
MPPYPGFRPAVWDPVLILAQITTLQCFGYSAFSFLAVVASLVSDVRLRPALLFDGELVRHDTVEGWIVALAMLAMAAANILPLVYMVERSRLCIDFSLTFFAVHLVLVWWHGGAPPPLPWWLLVAASAALMALGGRAACRRRELLPIAIRALMPDRPSERSPLPDEELELETRAPHDIPEVLFDASADPSAQSAPTTAAANLPKPNNVNDTWSNATWSSDEDDEDANAAAAAPSSARSNPLPSAPHPPPTSSSAAAPSSARPLMAKGTKDD